MYCTLPVSCEMVMNDLSKIILTRNIEEIMNKSIKTLQKNSDLADYIHQIFTIR